MAVTAMDGKKYVDLKGGINYDVGEIDRSIAAGDVRSGKVIKEEIDGYTVMSSGLKRVNTTEQHMLFLEAQSSASIKKEYTWNVDLAAAEGASVDPEIEKERKRLAKEAEKKRRAERSRLRRENTLKSNQMEKDAVFGKYAVQTDDDMAEDLEDAEDMLSQLLGGP